MPYPRPFRGFPWWLPLATAALAALLTALIVGSADAVWAAESRVWIRDDQLAMKDVESLFTDPIVLDTTLQWSGSDLSAAELADAVELVRDQRLFMIRVAADSPGEAEELADVLATVVVDECHIRNPGPSHAEALGTSWPGARRIAPRTAPPASLAGLGGLLGGIALAAVLTRRAQPQSPSPLALLGRRGWQPLALIPRRENAADGEPPASAVQLADAIGASLERGRTTAFAPLHDDADAALPALQAARALAGRGLSVLWLDARSERPVVLALPANLPGNPLSEPTTPVAPIDLDDAPLPDWLAGTPAPPWSERLRRLVAANSARFEAIVLVIDSPAGNARGRAALSAADRVALTARDDFDAAGAASALPASAPPVLGVALTHAPERRAADFQSAREAAREEADRDRARK